MKFRNVIAITLTLLAAGAALAEPPGERRTIVVRDGKIVSDGGNVLFDTELLGPRTYLGVTLVELTPELREHYGAPKDAGVLVSSVEENGPAARAGLKVGDIVLSLDGSNVNSASALRRELREKKDGESLRIDYLRGKGRQTAVATVVEREGIPLRMPAIHRLPMRGGEPGQWRAEVLPFGDCGELQSRIKELETRLKELEKKLK
jgi:membrane-associated protease RseP (regulator of RpoE activity)